MDPILTLIAVFSIFIPALMLPGPDFVAVVRAALTGGSRAGLLTATGVTLGLGFYATLSLVGLAAILVEYQWLTWIVRVLGGAYLIYLGIRLILTKPVEADDLNAAGAVPTGRPLRTLAFGFMVTMTNPKAIVLFASVFATSVTATTPDWLMALMVGLVMASTLTWYALVALVISRPAVMARFREAQHWIERAAGVCFVAIGGRILADSRNPVTP